MTASPNLPEDTRGPAAIADTYHDHNRALKWALGLETASWFPLVLGILALIFLIAELYTYIPQTLGSKFMDVVLGLGITILIPLTVTIISASLFVLLRAASQALLLLLDIQEGPTAS